MKSWVFCLLIMFLRTATGHCETRQALLIGVTNYAPQVAALSPPLTGPGHDVALMLETLSDAGLDQRSITVLTDRVDLLPKRWKSEARLPTRREILAALEQIAARSAPGERILLYFAGHGAQIPADNPQNEPDGLHEVLLASDFSIAADGTYENAILDDEIGAFIDQIVANGAHIWLVADACHSGSLRRSDTFGVAPRFVDLTHITARPTSEPESLVSHQNEVRKGAGSFVGFFAATAGNLAFETRPNGAESSHGMFTWSLVKALRQGGAATYADLAQAIGADLWATGHGRASPEFTGALRAAQMLTNQSATSSGFALRVDSNINFLGGRVDGLVPGSTLAIAANDGTPLFEVEVMWAGLTKAVANVPSRPMVQLDAYIAAEGLDPAQFRGRWLKDRAATFQARIVSMPVDFSLAVALVPDDMSEELGSQVATAIGELAPQVKITEVNPDIWVRAEGDRLYVHPFTPGAERAMSVPANSEAIPDLLRLLRRVVKVRNLLVVAREMAVIEPDRQLETTFYIAKGTAKAQGGCTRPEKLGTPFDPFAAQRPVIGHCETVSIEVRNPKSTPIDITPLYLAPDNQVYFLNGYAMAQRGGWRIPAGAASVLRYTEATVTAEGHKLPTGPMHILLLWMDAEDGTVPVDFRHLQDLDAPPSRRSGSAGYFSELIDAAGFGLAQKRSIGQTVLQDGHAISIPMQTTAGEGSLQRVR